MAANQRQHFPGQTSVAVAVAAVAAAAAAPAAAAVAAAAGGDGGDIGNPKSGLRNPRFPLSSYVQNEAACRRFE